MSHQNPIFLKTVLYEPDTDTDANTKIITSMIMWFVSPMTHCNIITLLSEK